MYPDKRITRMTSLKGYETLLLAPNSTTHVYTYETFPPFTQKRFNMIFFCIRTSGLDVLWGQPIKLIQVASNSELRENQWNDLLFFEIVPSHCFRASEVQT